MNEPPRRLLRRNHRQCRCIRRQAACRRHTRRCSKTILARMSRGRRRRVPSAPLVGTPVPVDALLLPVDVPLPVEVPLPFEPVVVPNEPVPLPDAELLSPPWFPCPPAVPSSVRTLPPQAAIRARMTKVDVLGRGTSPAYHDGVQQPDPCRCFCGRVLAHASRHSERPEPTGGVAAVGMRCLASNDISYGPNLKSC